ncbi:MAG: sulfate ABC transporter substrate-binding protein [Cyanobacteria bacterium P01_D01_bin.73]
MARRRKNRVIAQKLWSIHRLERQLYWFRNTEQLGKFLGAIAITFGLIACTGLPFQGNGLPSVEITLVSVNTTKAAYRNIIPAFTQEWRQTHNQNIIITQSYGPSGSQTRAVLDGLDADLVHLSLPLDIQKLEQEKLVASGWEKTLPNNSVPTESAVALIFRDGNPKNIQNWEDLTRSDISVLTADPKTSGAARWNFLALWQAGLRKGKTEAAAETFTGEVYGNAPILPRDSREATGIFYKQSRGDVLINYENEAILAAQNGEKLPYIVPPDNIRIENPVALVDRNVDKHNNRQAAEAFAQFLFTPDAQREFAKVGFRVVEANIQAEFSDEHPPLTKLVEASNFGTWSQIQRQFFDSGALFDQMRSSLNFN